MIIQPGRQRWQHRNETGPLRWLCPGGTIYLLLQVGCGLSNIDELFWKDDITTLMTVNFSIADRRFQIAD